MNTYRKRGIECLTIGLVCGVAVLVGDVAAVLHSAELRLELLAFALPLPHSLAVLFVIRGIDFLARHRRLAPVPTPNGWRVRIRRSDRLWGTAGVVTLISLVTASGYCVLFSEHSPLWWWTAAVPWLPGVLLAVVVGCWLPPDRWLDVDEVSRTACWARRRTGEVYAVPLDRVRGIGLRMGRPTPLAEGNYWMVDIHWRDDEGTPRRAALVRCGRYDDAETLAGWLRERLKVPALPEQPRRGDGE